MRDVTQILIGLRQAPFYICAPSPPRSEFVPGKGEYHLSWAWNNCCGSNGCMLPEQFRLLKSVKVYFKGSKLANGVNLL